MAAEHKIGDFVTYRQNGICRINKIVKQNFAGMGEREYFELSPVYDMKTVIFVPLDSEPLKAGMRHILSKEEIDGIINEAEHEELEWSNDTKDRAQKFGDILLEGDRAKILWVIKVLSIYKKELEEKKRKLYASDAKILSTAEKAITEEFSFVLGIKREEVLPYILEKIGK
ncbi:MAG: hypothetical protein E7647_03725 [Ruminococcaceae bacterium]|nr:hypothetical protein [Oscillospiraceae bacterium]